jgi:hypothetical protein
MKRWVVTVLFFLLLGGLLNVAVAWAIALRVPPQHANPSFKGRAPLIEDDFGCLFGQWEVEVRSEPGWMGIQSMRVRNRVVGANRAAGGVVSEETQLAKMLPSWEKALQTPGRSFAMHLRKQERRYLVATGWPCRTAWYEIEDVPGGSQRQIRGALDVGPRPVAANQLLPFRPIWRGLVTNSLLYGATCWLMVAGARTLRRWWRIKRGLCPACAYPVGTSQLCTECGKLVKPSDAQAYA